MKFTKLLFVLAIFFSSTCFADYISDPSSLPTYKPISYKCPNDNGNLLEFVKKNTVGAVVTVVGTFNRSELVNILIQVAQPNEPYQIIRNGPPNQKLLDEREDRVFTRAKNQIFEMKEIVCDSSDATIRGRYDKILDDNRIALKKAQQTLPDNK